jgi:sugar lactone lactonase YvrE
MMRPGLLLLLITAPALAAQRPSDLALVDSAAAARSAWGRAVAAYRANDIAIARREVDRAARAWPTQHAYQWARAIAAARQGDTAGVREGLEAYASLGLGRNLRSDSTIAPFATRPDFAALLAAHGSNRAAIIRSTPEATLQDSTFYPEGVDYDPRTGNFYLASIRHRTIAEITPKGKVRLLWKAGRAGMGALFGVRVDTARGVLWATTSGVPQSAGFTPADSGIAALLRIRIEDGTIEQRWDLPVLPGGHVLGDLALGPNGTVYFTDSNQPHFYVLAPGSENLERITSPLFRSLQGIAPSPDGRAVYLADYSHGILRFDLSTRSVTRLEDAPRSTSLGCDGIVWYRGSIITVQNGVAPARIMRFTLDPAGLRIVRADLLDRNSGIADEPTIGTLAGDSFVYVANSQWEKYSDTGARLPIPLKPPVLLSIPLK